MPSCILFNVGQFNDWIQYLDSSNFPISDYANSNEVGYSTLLYFEYAVISSRHKIWVCKWHCKYPIPMIFQYQIVYSPISMLCISWLQVIQDYYAYSKSISIVFIDSLYTLFDSLIKTFIWLFTSIQVILSCRSLFF